jgi:hypothetical protein
MSDSDRLDKTISHYNASKVLLVVLLVIANIATITLLVYSTLLLVDCTTPKGDCTKRGQEQTKQALIQIARHDEAVTFCANRTGNDTIERLRACVAKEIKK